MYVRFSGQLFRQTVGIPIETKCALLLADLFLYCYENEFLDEPTEEGKSLLESSISYIITLMTLSLSIIKVQF